MVYVFAKFPKWLYESEYESRMQTNICISLFFDNEDGDVFDLCLFEVVVSI